MTTTTKIDCKFCNAPNTVNTIIEGKRIQDIVFRCVDCDQTQTVKLIQKPFHDPQFKKEEWYITPISSSSSR